MDRFVTVWNWFAGVDRCGADLKPVKKFENRNKAVSALYAVISQASEETERLEIAAINIDASLEEQQVTRVTRSERGSA